MFVGAKALNQINLLPWREKKRRQEKRKFRMMCLFVSILAVVTLVLIHDCILGLEKNQSVRNQMLKTQSIQQEDKIKELNSVKMQIENISSKMSIIQQIQSRRIFLMHLLSELTKAMPPGVYLNRLESQQDLVSLWAYTDSNTNISQMMRNLEHNDWIQKPRLGEIKKKEGKNQSEINEFILNFGTSP